MRGFSLGFTNPVGALEVCLCFGCCGGVGGERVGGFNQGLEGWDGVMSL